jgi:ABC-type uncharacterized transport system involved in gliding motility auxiliary subunit
MFTKILNIVLWIGTALVMGAVAVRLLRPEWDQYASYAAWAGLACVVLYVLGQGPEVVQYFRRRNARYGAIATLSAVIFIAILVAVNYLSVRQNKRWDLTSNRQFTLSDQTVTLLNTSTRHPRESTCGTSTRTRARSRRVSTRCKAMARWSSSTRAEPNA